MGNLLKYIFLKNTYAIGTTGTEHLNESEKTTSLNVINLSICLQTDCSYLLALLLQNNGVEQLCWNGTVEQNW